MSKSPIIDILSDTADKTIEYNTNNDNSYTITHVNEHIIGRRYNVRKDNNEIR